VEFEAELDEKRRANAQSSPIFSSSRQSRLSHFLSNLAMRANDPPYDISDQTTAGTSSPHIPAASVSLNNIQASSNTNPEADSFAYMETLLESFAVLGKLGSALDNVGQRLPGEVFSLVETTLDEVEERAEYTRRQNNGTAGPGTSVRKSDSVYLFFLGGRSISLAPSMMGKGKEPLVKSQMLRLAALESSAKQADHEVLKDLFWTLYSKMDAVAQGLRVVSEVANRIGSVRSSSAFFLVYVSNYGVIIREENSETHLVQNQDHYSR
jgi:exocyst complex component 4